MFSFTQIFLYLATLHCICSLTFLGEIKFKKNFEIEHKPKPFPPFKPLEFIKEIVTPFGKFGMKHGIGKRDLDSIKTVDSKPDKVPLWSSSAEDRYEVEEEVDYPARGPASFLPSPVPPAVGHVSLRPGPIGPAMGPVIDIPKQQHQRELEVLGPKPIPAPPHPPVIITPPPPKIEKPLPLSTPILEKPLPTGFNTDIAREQAINEYLKSVVRQEIVPVENNIAPEKPKEEVPPPPPPAPVEPPPNPIVRGSRLALYFGNILLDVLSQFLGGGRLGAILDRPVTI